MDKVNIIQDFIIDRVSDIESAKDLLLYLSAEVPDEECAISSNRFHEIYMNNIFKTCVIQSNEVTANHEFAIDEEYVYIFTEIIGMRIPPTMTKFTLDRMINIINSIERDERNNR